MVAVTLVVVVLVSPPLVLAKKFSSGHPGTAGKELTHCNPCPFNSINKPSYEIRAPDCDSAPTSSSSSGVFFCQLQPIYLAGSPEDPAVSFPPLLC